MTPLDALFLSYSKVSSLYVEWGKHTVEVYTRHVTYTLQNFVADCGGLIGLFLGLSLLSIFEIFCNFLITCCDLRRKRENRIEAWSEK
jgi:hypothetical protein